MISNTQFCFYIFNLVFYIFKQMNIVSHYNILMYIVMYIHFAFIFWSANNLYKNIMHLVDILGENIMEIRTLATG